ncbi:uncharacterized protein ARMOST_17952 [Armillaria ostoyae]|uniref:Uncharacterized protein n=1 Tax=Armillaria ostoyae TaxID=47428 RepID=A0A284S0E3_ARMOS|nr:uncharacterized protein ARMOST_17952 [Armillaria ostoyae]
MDQMQYDRLGTLELGLLDPGVFNSTLCDFSTVPSRRGKATRRLVSYAYEQLSVMRIAIDYGLKGPTVVCHAVAIENSRSG